MITPKDNNSGIWLVLVIIAVVGLLFGALFLSFYEYGPYEVDSHLTEEARQNRYLLVETFLNRSGYEIEVRDVIANMDDLPDPGGVLVLDIARNTFTYGHHKSLLAWVAEGGHLIVVPQHFELEVSTFWDVQDPEIETSGDDPILSAIGVYAVEEGELHGVVGLSFGEESEEYRFEIQSSLRLSADEDAYENLSYSIIMDDQNFPVLVGSDYQKGHISVFVDLEFLDNDNFTEFDNAAFFRRMVTYHHEEPSLIQLVHTESYPGLFQLIRKNAWMCLIALVVWIAGLLWRRMPRLGRKFPDPIPVRRSLMEHIVASGHFLWRHRQAERMVTAIREGVHDHMCRRRGDLIHLDEEERFVRLAQLTGLSEADIRAAMEGTSWSEADSYLRTVHQLQIIRRSL